MLTFTSCCVSPFFLGGVALSGCVRGYVWIVECGVQGLLLLVYEVVGVALVVWGVKFRGVMVVEGFSYLRVCD